MTTSLVLGATGFIGGQIVRSALGRGWQVRALRRNPHAVGAIGDLQPDWISGNLDDSATLREAMRGCEVVFHAAAAYPHSAKNIDQHVQAAVTQLRGVLDAARAAKVDRLIYTSSFTTIGPARDRSRGADEQDRYVPGSAGDAYYEAKWAMEVEALKSDVPVIALCPSAVFGPGDVHLSVSGIVVQTAQGKMPVYFDATFGAIDVRDVAEAHVNAVERGRVGERYILSAHNITLLEGLTLVAQSAGVRPPRIKIGPRLLNGIIAVGQYLPGGTIGHLRTMKFWQPLNNAKAVTELGLKTRPIKDTLDDALAWFRERGVIGNR
ncbi:MAG: NAD-dependent epimerase/dehydratase family protein [Chloroflexi bacterium]|nr:NAD-dependent epimerase/dehydratase family protein [Chloroflexota bacterium]